MSTAGSSSDGEDGHEDCIERRKVREVPCGELLVQVPDEVAENWDVDGDTTARWEDIGEDSDPVVSFE